MPVFLTIHFLSPQGAPGPPGEPFISRYGTALTLHWTSGDQGRAPITRYVIEARPSGEPHEFTSPSHESSLREVCSSW